MGYQPCRDRPTDRSFDDLSATVDFARTAAGAIDWSPLRIEVSPHILLGWTPELAAIVLTVIGLEAPSG